MSFLSPPTDSIYKFAAIAGLVIFGYMGYFQFKPNEYDLIESNLSAEWSTIEGDFENLKDELIYSPDSSLDSLQKNNLVEITIDSVSKQKFKEVIYNSDDGIISKYQSLLSTLHTWSGKWNKNKSNRSDSDIMRIVYLLLLYIAEIPCVWGMIRWYQNVQKPIDDEYEQKRLAGELYEVKCQSCYKTINLIEERGTETNGVLSKNFCSNCYTEGVYTEPELTFETATKRLERELKNLGYSRWRRRKTMKKFRYTARWNGQTNW